MILMPFKRYLLGSCVRPSNVARRLRGSADSLTIPSPFRPRRTIESTLRRGREGQVVGAEQGTIQAVNRTIRDFAEDPRIPPEEEWEFFCECGCFTLVHLTLVAFDGGDGDLGAGARRYDCGHDGA